MPSPDSAPMIFAPEAPAPRVRALTPWKILVVDDDSHVHAVTKMALLDFRHDGRALQFIHAYNGVQAIARVRENPDIALVFMDIVMETERAGLQALLAIRHELGNVLTRIIVRTGQPAQAPEALVVKHCDVSDYREKPEMTRQKLHSLVHSNLRLYTQLRDSATQ